MQPNLQSGLAKKTNHDNKMDKISDYLNVNKEAWNKKTPVHFASEFYDNEAFIAGKNSLNSIELALLGDVKEKRILHLQCHFGQDSISLARMGAEVTGVDLSDVSIKIANELAEKTDTSVRFIECDLYSLDQVLNEQFDIVFTSYGTIGWLPDMDRWADVVSKFLNQVDSLFLQNFIQLFGCSTMNLLVLDITISMTARFMKPRKGPIPIVMQTSMKNTSCGTTALRKC